jgi:hypothetical protein
MKGDGGGLAATGYSRTMQAANGFKIGTSEKAD